MFDSLIASGVTGLLDPFSTAAAFTDALCFLLLGVVGPWQRRRAYADFLFPAGVGLDDLAEQELLPLCASTWRPCLRNPDPSFMGYCCHRCGMDGKHGWKCQLQLPPPSPLRVLGNLRGARVAFLHGIGGNPSDLRQWT